MQLIFFNLFFLPKVFIKLWFIWCLQHQRNTRSGKPSRSAPKRLLKLQDKSFSSFGLGNFIKPPKLSPKKCFHIFDIKSLWCFLLCCISASLEIAWSLPDIKDWQSDPWGGANCRNWINNYLEWGKKSLLTKLSTHSYFSFFTGTSF